jgi:hypothetical protein
MSPFRLKEEGQDDKEEQPNAFLKTTAGYLKTGHE